MKRSAKAKKPVLSRKGVSDNWKQFLHSSGQPVKLCAVMSTPTKRKRIIPSSKKQSKVVALDCEMVAAESGENLLARVSVVDYHLNCIYDKCVKPDVKVGDYRTRFSGVRAKDLENGEKLSTVQKEVKELLLNKILVGHSLRNDFNVLGFGHHSKLIRDTSLYKPFREVSKGKTPSLKKLVEQFLSEKIQQGEHNSIEDAAATMKLYKKFKNEWERSLLTKSNPEVEAKPAETVLLDD